MVTNIESRIEALEARLVPVDPAKLMVIILAWVGRDSTPDQITAYSEGMYSDENKHVLRREPNESPEAFEKRAITWARFEHRHDNPPRSCVVLHRVTAARCA